MRAFQVETGMAAPLLQANIDTDVIIRIERLTQGDRHHLGEYALEALRYLPDGRENPDCILNADKFRGAPFIIAGPNFGCGSSREGAVVALMQMGVTCIMAESFGDIFYGNCFQNGLLPIRLPRTAVEALETEAREDGRPFTVDLRSQIIATPQGERIAFEIEPLRREALLAGLDDIGLTLREAEIIEAWQARDQRERPWIWRPAAPAAAPTLDPAHQGDAR